MKTYKPGIYFGMPFEEYLAIPALSSSGIKKMRVSPQLFWADSWMNPLRKRKKTDAFNFGTAYHKRILEGSKSFNAEYAPKFEPDPSIDYLVTMDDIKAELAKFGISPGNRKADAIAKLLSVAPTYQIYDVDEAHHNNQYVGRELIDADAYRMIELSGAMVDNNPQTSRLVNGGVPEVVVIWEQDGVLLKCRFDYLAPGIVTDVKTYENSLELPIMRAIVKAIANYKYHVQAAFYGDFAAPKAVEFAQSGAVFGTITSTSTMPLDNFINELAMSKGHDYWFLFQMKGQAPIARGVQMARGLNWDNGVNVVKDCIELFKQYHDHYGDNMWIDPAELDILDDSVFPSYMAEF